MAFKFKYQKLLDQKIELENQCKLRLAEAIANLTRKKNEIKQLNIRKKSFDEEHVKSLSQGMKSEQLRSYNEYRLWYKSELARLDGELNVVKSVLLNARADLKKANTEVKKFEKLKENAQIEYREQEQIKFSKMIEEIISYNHFKK